MKNQTCKNCQQITSGNCGAHTGAYFPKTMPHKDTIEGLITEFEDSTCPHSFFKGVSPHSKKDCAKIDWSKEKQALQKSFHAGLQRAGEIVGEKIDGRHYAVGANDVFRHNEAIHSLEKFHEKINEYREIISKHIKDDLLHALTKEAETHN